MRSRERTGLVPYLAPTELGRTPGQELEFGGYEPNRMRAGPGHPRGCTCGSSICFPPSITSRNCYECYQCWKKIVRSRREAGLAR